MTLSELVAAGAGRVQVVSGAGARPRSVAALAEAGARHFRAGGAGGAVGLVMTSDPITVELLFGALAAGARIVSIPQPGRGGVTPDYARLVTGAAERFGATEVVAPAELGAPLAACGVRGVRLHHEVRRRPLDVAPAAAFELVQFSSGTTARPKPIVLDDAGLGRNVEAILDRIGPRAGDGVISWLPLSHDMGLIGMLLAGVAGLGAAGGGEVVLVEPEWFMRSPGAWWRLVERHRSTVTAMPDFGLRLLTRRSGGAAVDLSSLRCIIVGGELVRVATLGDFAGAHGSRGLRPEALAPAYGLAELGLAATMTPPGSGWRWQARALDGAGHNGGPAWPLVAAGPPLGGYDVEVTDSTAGVGRLRVRGPSLGVDGFTSARFAGPDGWYTTGDLGFVDDDGWVYVCGRVDDQVVAHGRQLHAPAVEAAVCAVPGVRDGRAAALGLPSGEWVVVVETTRSRRGATPEGQRLRREVRRVAVEAAGVQPDAVHCVPAGTLPFTSSGKLQRGRLVDVVAAGGQAADGEEVPWTAVP